MANGNHQANNLGRIVRGIYNFKRLSDIMEYEDITTMVYDQGLIDPKDAFQEYAKTLNTKLPFTSYIENSFPGLLIPVEHKPSMLP